MPDITLEVLARQNEQILRELADIRASTDGLDHKFDAILPLVEGIPLLAKGITVLQRDVQRLNDDMRVSSSLAMRVDHTLTDVLTELQAIHRWMVGVQDRLRKLEDTP